MRPVFVETRNYSAFCDAIEGLQSRGAEECRLIVVDGAPGLGKTTILHRWAAMESCFYLRAKEDWTSYWLMKELLECGRAAVPHGHEARFSACLQMLAERQRVAEMTRQSFAIVLDEADYISSKSKLMNLVRDLADIAAVPIVLVGMGKIRDQLVRYPQTARRISRYVRFEPADISDVQKFLDAKCEVKVAPDLAAFVHSASGGYNSEVLEAVRNIERFGRNKPTGPEGLTLRDMAGQLLMNDRRSGSPVTVPGGMK